MGKLNFEDELYLLRKDPTHKKVMRFLKKRKLRCNLQVTHKQGTMYYFTRVFNKGQKNVFSRAYCIKVPHERAEKTEET